MLLSSGVPLPTRTISDPPAVEFGVQINGCDGDPDALTQLAKSLGFTWIKQQFRWGDLSPAPDQVDWRCLDRVTSAAQTHNMKLMVSITTSPRWSRNSPTVYGPPDNIQPWRHLISTLVRRYAHHLHALELWNEPNLAAEWDNSPNPLYFSKMVLMGYIASKSIKRDIIVITGAVAPIDGSHVFKYMSDLEFLDQAFREGAMTDAYDCLGVHANGPPGIGFVPEVLERYRTYYASRPDIPPRPLCLTEFSYSIPIAGQLPEGFNWASVHDEALGAQRIRDWLVEIERSKLVHLAILFNLGYHDGITPNSIAALDRPGLRGDILKAISEYLLAR